jgi:Predicted acyltransferase
MIEIHKDDLSVEEYYELYSLVGWSVPSKEQIEKALQKSLLTVKAKIDEKTVGMGRLIGDGSLSFMVKDVAILPEYQRQGIGKKIMESMISHIKQQIPKGQNVCVELFSGFEKEAFYEQFGFDKKPDGFVGHGMMMLEAGER